MGYGTPRCLQVPRMFTLTCKWVLVLEVHYLRPSLDSFCLLLILLCTPSISQGSSISGKCLHNSSKDFFHPSLSLPSLHTLIPMCWSHLPIFCVFVFPFHFILSYFHFMSLFILSFHFCASVEPICFRFLYSSVISKSIFFWVLSHFISYLRVFLWPSWYDCRFPCKAASIHWSIAF